MKDQLQKEILAKVKPGTKPSDLKKLKRSKSLSDIPKAPKSTPLTKSQSAQELEPASSKIENLETKISSLELKLEVSSRELTESQAEKQLFSDQLKVKQKALEETRSSLEKAQEKIKDLTTTKSNLLDDNLALKHQGLKEWFKQYELTQKLDAELKENVDYASEELVRQDQKISQLRTENFKLKQTNQSLTKDLKLTEKLAQLRKEPLSLEKD